MATTQPPPAYTGDQAPPAYTGDQAPPAPSAQQVTGEKMKMYWIYWGVLSATILTWIFAVAAAAGAWTSPIPVTLRTPICRNTAYFTDEYEEACALYTAGGAFHYIATVIVSVILVLVVVAAFTAAPITGKLGKATGITLAVYSVFQLIAFSLLASWISKWGDAMFGDIGLGYNPGPAFGLAVVAWIFGTAGAIAVVVLRARETDVTNLDGPLRKFVQNANGVSTANPAGPPAAAAPAVGTV